MGGGGWVVRGWGGGRRTSATAGGGGGPLAVELAEAADDTGPARRAVGAVDLGARGDIRRPDGVVGKVARRAVQLWFARASSAATLSLRERLIGRENHKVRG